MGGVLTEMGQQGKTPGVRLYLFILFVGTIVRMDATI